MTKIPWTQQILGTVDESRSLLETLRKWQKNSTGHVLRHDSSLHKVIEGRRRLRGKKTSGRPRAMLLDAMMQEDEENEKDRETWHH